MARLFAAPGRWPKRRVSLMASPSPRPASLQLSARADPPGWRATPWLLHLVKQAAQERWRRHPPKLRRLIAEEIRLIRANDCAHYFLTVHDIVRYARSQGILCWAGSAANSVVCFCWGHLGRSDAA
jgi:DNA polymerase III alpha subunit